MWYVKNTYVHGHITMQFLKRTNLEMVDMWSNLFKSLRATQDLIAWVTIQEQSYFSKLFKIAIHSSKLILCDMKLILCDMHCRFPLTFLTLQGWGHSVILLHHPVSSTEVLEVPDFRPPLTDVYVPVFINQAINTFPIQKKKLNKLPFYSIDKLLRADMWRQQIKLVQLQLLWSFQVFPSSVGKARQVAIKS